MAGSSVVVTPAILSHRTSAAGAALKRKRDFKAHLAAYVIINAFLVVVWYLNGRGYFWPGWVLAGWGIGLAFNAWDAYGRRGDISEAEIQREMERRRR
jgi:hypothetical protein